MKRIVYNKLLGGWYVVRGPHQTPLNARFESRAAAEAWLERRLYYRGVKVDVFQDPQSLAWFYQFGLDWTWHRASRGYANDLAARDACEAHVDKVLFSDKEQA